MGLVTPAPKSPESYQVAKERSERQQQQKFLLPELPHVPPGNSLTARVSVGPDR